MKRLIPRAVLGLLFVSVAMGQCAPSAWSSMNPFEGTDAPVTASTTWDPDGSGPLASRLVIGGGFTAAGSTVAMRVAMWDGTAWSAIGAGFDDYTFCAVTSLVVYAGQLVAVARDWSQVSFIFRWDGASWQLIGSGIDGAVHALVVYDGELIVGGDFHVANGILARRVVRWNGTTWSAFGTPFTNTWLSFFTVVSVKTLAVHDGDLIVGGAFQSAGGLAASNIVRWDGAAWHEMGTGLGGTCLALTSMDGWLIAGGAFSEAGNVASPRAARWNGYGWNECAVKGTGPLSSSAVFCFTVHDGVLIAGLQTGDVVRRIGNEWQPFLTVAALACIQSDKDGVVVGSSSQPFIRRWDGTALRPFETGINGRVRAFTNYAGDLIVGGSFTHAPADVVANRVARWDGEGWSALGSAMNHDVLALAVFQDQLIAAGRFTSADGLTANGLARWSGSAWVPITFEMSSIFAPPAVHALCVWDGALIAGGNFTTIDGLAVGGVARWDGSAWQPLGSGVSGFAGSPYFSVLSLRAYDGELFVGGDFHFPAVGGNAVGIARWNGASWVAGPTLGPTCVLPRVHTMAEYAGELILGGIFGMNPSGVPTGLARWNGSVVAEIEVPFVGSSHECSGSGELSISALAVFEDKLIVGGQFCWDPPSPAVGCDIAAWAGNSWTPLGTGGLAGFVSPYQSFVSALFDYRGTLMVGGAFNHAGGLPSPCLARWGPSLPFFSVSQPGGAGAATLVVNRWLEPGREYFNIASPDVSSGSPGDGPWGGLHFTDPSLLCAQLALPIGTLPFHFVANSSTQSCGLYSLPAGLTFEAMTVDVTGGTLGCRSSVQRCTVY